MKLWIDTNGCEEHWHMIVTGGDGSDVRHADDTPCDDSEFKFEEDNDDDN